ncbi:MBOAT family O-acyltransferase, partial [Aliarcobacter butzleri]
SLSYTFQLYFDFSGYCDMAIGISLMFNIKLPINFNSPYKALSIQDFWRRWHMTLSRFLRDYIYIPLGGNRKGNTRTYVNLLSTFLIGGLWHGAGWTFIIWGALHGIALAIHRFWQSLGFKMNKILAWFITFNFVNIAWIFFRAKEWDDAIKVLGSMFSLDNVVLPNLEFINNLKFMMREVFINISQEPIEIILWITFGFVLILAFKNSMEKMDSFKVNKKTVLLNILLFVFGVLSLNKVSEFLYFNF